VSSTGKALGLLQNGRKYYNQLYTERISTMSRYLLVIAVAVGMMSASSCNTTSGKATSSTTPATGLAAASTENVEQAVRQLDNERTQATQKSDTAFIERVYADDYVVIAANGRVRNKAQVVADYKSGVLKVESIKDDELKGRVYGDFVVIPSECMVGDDYLFLDDLTIKDVERELGVAVVPSGYDARDFVRFLRAGREKERAPIK